MSEEMIAKAEVEKMTQSAASKAKGEILAALGIANVEEGKTKLAFEDKYNTLAGSHTELQASFKELEGKYTTLETTHNEASTKYTELVTKNRRNEILLAGAEPTFVDYLIGQLGDDGDIAEYLEKNPKFKSEHFVKINSDPGFDGKGKVALEGAANYEDYKDKRKKIK